MDDNPFAVIAFFFFWIMMPLTVIGLIIDSSKKDQK